MSVDWDAFCCFCDWVVLLPWSSRLCVIAYDDIVAIAQTCKWACSHIGDTCAQTRTRMRRLAGDSTHVSPLVVAMLTMACCRAKMPLEYTGDPALRTFPMRDGYTWLEPVERGIANARYRPGTDAHPMGSDANAYAVKHSLALSTTCILVFGAAKMPVAPQLRVTVISDHADVAVVTMQDRGRVDERGRRRWVVAVPLIAGTANTRWFGQYPLVVCVDAGVNLPVHVEITGVYARVRAVIRPNPVWTHVRGFLMSLLQRRKHTRVRVCTMGQWLRFRADVAREISLKCDDVSCKYDKPLSRTAKGAVADTLARKHALDAHVRDCCICRDQV